MENLLNTISQRRILETSLLRPFEEEANRDMIEDDAGVEEVDFRVEDCKSRELFDH